MWSVNGVFVVVLAGCVAINLRCARRQYDEGHVHGAQVGIGLAGLCLVGAMLNLLQVVWS